MIKVLSSLRFPWWFGWARLIVSSTCTLHSRSSSWFCQHINFVLRKCLWKMRAVSKRQLLINTGQKWGKTYIRRLILMVKSTSNISFPFHRSKERTDIGTGKWKIQAAKLRQWSEHWCITRCLGFDPSCAAWICSLRRPDVRAFLSTGEKGMV